MYLHHVSAPRYGYTCSRILRPSRAGRRAGSGGGRANKSPGARLIMTLRRSFCPPLPHPPACQRLTLMNIVLSQSPITLYNNHALGAVFSSSPPSSSSSSSCSSSLHPPTPTKPCFLGVGEHTLAATHTSEETCTRVPAILRRGPPRFGLNLNAVRPSVKRAFSAAASSSPPGTTQVGRDSHYSDGQRSLGPAERGKKMQNW